MTVVDSLVWEGRFLLLARKGLHPPFGGDTRPIKELHPNRLIYLPVQSFVECLHVHVLEN